MHNLAAPEQARAQDTLRWGGMFSVAIPVGPSQATLDQAVREAAAHSGKQLVNAHWRWPLAWRVALLVTPQQITGDVNVQFEIIVGSGDAQQRILRTVTVSNGSIDTAVDNALALPACDLLIRAVTITTEGEGGHPIAGPGYVEIGAFVAPETEPHAMLHMLECLGKMCGGAEGAGHRDGGWMPPGFTPEGLGYGR
jgi:hypothetical protein